MSITKYKYGQNDLPDIINYNIRRLKLCNSHKKQIRGKTICMLCSEGRKCKGVPENPTMHMYVCKADLYYQHMAYTAPSTSGN